MLLLVIFVCIASLDYHLVHLVPQEDLAVLITDSTAASADHWAPWLILWQHAEGAGAATRRGRPDCNRCQRGGL